jgi:hypothetical protein
MNTRRVVHFAFIARKARSWILGLWLQPALQAGVGFRQRSVCSGSNWLHKTTALAYTELIGRWKVPSLVLETTPRRTREHGSSVDATVNKTTCSKQPTRSVE